MMRYDNSVVPTLEGGFVISPYITGVASRKFVHGYTVNRNMLRGRLLTELLPDVRGDRKDISDGEVDRSVAHCFEYTVAGFRIFEGKLILVLGRVSLQLYRLWCGRRWRR